MSSFEYFLFPHTVLHETDCRHLAVLIPHLQLLQIARPAVLPAWGQGFFSARPAISAEQSQQVKALLKEYKNFAELVGDGATLASLAHFSDADNRQESRFRIQSALKGREQQLQKSQAAPLEAALFLEMARDLDQQGMELDTDITRTGHIEREFRDIVGIADEEEVDEPLEIGDMPLIAEKSYLSFKLQKRMASWLRLFAGEGSAGTPVLVAIVPEVLEEILESLTSPGDAALAPPTGVVRTPLLSIPVLAGLNDEQFQRMLAQMEGSGTRQSYRLALANVLRSPNDSTFLDELRIIAAQLDSALADACGKEQRRQYQRANLSLASVASATIGELHARLDKSGNPFAGVDPVGRQAILVLSYETSSSG